ncbi:hypothetical protein [Stakelama pacifica]|uniref:Uncharacterized protein n=1 Tax=Stakelama pacifica TaxID=517720 RepID=A0A4R6F9Y5_9SPHN|nr:hypothetical protein [Stakelama pacifica]TDN77747.1 hypothetical protein EV664_12610 [Stakelama pacifica]GGP00883.1 hypothetical protein GCM10011329_37790 [Stakelama pacifica]
MTSLKEEVALALLNDDRAAAGLPPVASRDNVPDSDGYVRNAGVQYDPAPYTAMKYRLRSLLEDDIPPDLR